MLIMDEGGLADEGASDEPTNMNEQMQSCLKECLRCYQTCLGTAMSHRLESDGKLSSLHISGLCHEV